MTDGSSGSKLGHSPIGEEEGLLGSDSLQGAATLCIRPSGVHVCVCGVDIKASGVRGRFV